MSPTTPLFQWLLRPSFQVLPRDGVGVVTPSPLRVRQIERTEWPSAARAKIRRTTSASSGTTSRDRLSSV